MPITYNNPHSPYDNDNVNNNNITYNTGEYNLNDIYGGVANYELDDFAGVDNTPPTLDDYPGSSSYAYNTATNHDDEDTSSAHTDIEPPSYRRSNSRIDVGYGAPKAASVSRQEPGSITINRSASADQLPSEQVAAATTVASQPEWSPSAVASSHFSMPDVYKDNPRLRRQLKIWAPCLTGYPIITRDSLTRGKPHIGYYALILLVGLFMLGIFGMDLYFFIQYAVLNAFHQAADDPPFQWVSVGYHARGFIAIGDYSHGVISIGQFAMGIVALGQLGIGVVTIAQCGIGLLFSVGMASSSLVFAAGIVSMAFYTRFTIIGVALWNSSASVLGIRSLYCFFEWRFLFKEDAEEYERFVASIPNPKLDYRGKPFVAVGKKKR